MIIGCTGNFRKAEYYTILERVYAILVKSDIKCGENNSKVKENTIVEAPVEETPEEDKTLTIEPFSKPEF